MTLTYRRVRAPREHGERLIDPPFPRLVESVETNARLLGSISCSLNGVSFTNLRDQARQELVSSATSFVSQYRDVDERPFSTIVMSGHQPQLFHPGVWFKNFQLDAVARASDSVGLQLIIDNDLCRVTSVRVPSGSVEAATWTSVQYDRNSDALPYESRRIIDYDVFSRFGDRCSELIKPIVRNPLVGSYWPTVVDAARRQPNLGLALSRARHQLETDWGLRTLELPLSIACETTAFRQLTASVLLNLQPFAEQYNSTVKQYRRIHRIRNHAHPVPDLGREGSMREAPFWIWTNDNPVRRSLWVQSKQSTICLSDRDGGRWELPKNASRIIDAMEQMKKSGCLIRPRALITTLFARMFLCDLFIHGIGGSKYDQLTDELIRFLFHSEPPKYATATATVNLPSKAAPSTRRDLVRIDQQLRDMHFHPEAYVNDHTDKVSRLIQRKKNLFRNCPTQGKRENWHAEIEQINTQLRFVIQDKCNRLQQARYTLAGQVRSSSVISSREIPFCLYPMEVLRACLLDGHS